MFSPLLSYIKEIKINFAKSNNVQMTLGLLLTQLQPFICFGVKNKPTSFQPLTWRTRHQSQHLAAAGAATKPAFTSLTGGGAGWL